MPEAPPIGGASRSYDKGQFRPLVELFGHDLAGVRIGMKLHLLTVLDAFSFPPTIVGLDFADLRIARLKSLLDYLLSGHPILAPADRRHHQHTRCLPKLPDRAVVTTRIANLFTANLQAR